MNVKKDQKMEGISRIDAERAQGWYLRIYYSPNETHAKFFSDGVYGGQQNALKATLEYKEAYIRQNPPPPKLPFKRKPIKTNTSGVNGVSETYTWSKRNQQGEKVPCFCVSWAPEPNTHKTKKFYHHHYDSREEAFAAAVKFRQEKERERLKKWAKRRGQPLEVYLEALNR